MGSELTAAVSHRRIITFWYNGLVGTAEPHTYGLHKDTGHEVLSCFQTAGFSHSGELPGWRLYLLSEIRNLSVTGDIYPKTRPGYNPNDSRMQVIIARAQ
ncbi:MAG: hypothetical protein HY552_03975 [Elusimicrobia bacterium]|nr:hypothetical protein [Elusimicrobiota bacterium]